jgi:DNA repair exonuclease SbcCD ATPase subunit
MEPRAEITETAVAQQIGAAVTALDNEHECLEDERAAFAQFRKRVANMDAHAPTINATAKVKNAIMGTSTATASSSQLKQIRSAYHETVMNVPHYEDDYDLSLDQDLAEEFSPEIATAFATADSLTPPLHETLLTASQQATESRTALLDALDREAESLQQVHDTLEAMNTALTELNQRPIAAWSEGELTAGYERLADLEAQCDDLAAERQEELRSQRIRGPKHADEELNEYLYDSLPVTYPILADLAGFTSLLHTARQHLEQALIAR